METWKDWASKSLYKIIESKDFAYIPDYLVWPSKNALFKAFKACPLNRVKVVMIGELPYTLDNRATGLLFANPKGTKNLSGPLCVIREAVIDYTVPHGIVDFDVTLESWARQGVLLLNYPLAVTYSIHNLKHDKELWLPFMIELLKFLQEYSNGLAYVLFGYARELGEYIDKDKNYVLTEESPSHYYKHSERMSSDILERLDSYLSKQYGEKIKWYEER